MNGPNQVGHESRGTKRFCGLSQLCRPFQVLIHIHHGFLEVRAACARTRFLQAIKGLHDSLTAQLDQLDAKVQRLADERPAHFLRRRSSTPALLKSKSQAPTILNEGLDNLLRGRGSDHFASRSIYGPAMINIYIYIKLAGEKS